MQTDGAIIYVAGNPDLYPMEYYDPENETYQGAIPDFLAGFAQEYGYDLRYFQGDLLDTIQGLEPDLVMSFYAASSTGVEAVFAYGDLE